MRRNPQRLPVPVHVEVVLDRHVRSGRFGTDRDGRPATPGASSATSCGTYRSAWPARRMAAPAFCCSTSREISGRAPRAARSRESRAILQAATPPAASRKKRTGNRNAGRIQERRLDSGAAPARPAPAGRELLLHLVARREAVLRTLLEGTPNDALDLLGHVRAHGLQGRGRIAENRRQRQQMRVPGEGPAAGEHLVEHGAKGEDVGARVHGIPLRLLGGHVGDRAQDHALPGAHVGGTGRRGRVGGHFPGRGRPGSMSLARPKSRTLTRPPGLTITLAGLTSRWTIPAACAAPRADAICSP